MSGARAVTDAEFDTAVLASDKTVLVDFWAEWCGPCRGVAPILDALAVDLADKLEIVKMDVDANPLTTGKYAVSSIPALLLFKNGEVVTTIIGAKPRGMIESAIAPYLD